jgi:hypothetical protein
MEFFALLLCLFVRPMRSPDRPVDKADTGGFGQRPVLACRKCFFSRPPVEKEPVQWKFFSSFTMLKDKWRIHVETLRGVFNGKQIFNFVTYVLNFFRLITELELCRFLDFILISYTHNKMKYFELMFQKTSHSSWRGHDLVF